MWLGESEEQSELNLNFLFTPPHHIIHQNKTAKTADEAPFLAEVELCGSTFVSDHHWRCSNEPPIDDTWLLPTFRETSNWKPATWARCASCVAGPAISAAKSPATMRSKAADQTLNATTVAAKKTNKKTHLKPKDQAQPLHFFSQDGRRYIQPSPRLDQEAEEAWREWQQAKEEANSAWRAWRHAREQQQRNGTSTGNSTTILPDEEQGILASSMASGGNGTINVNATIFSTDWKDHMNVSAADVTLKWSKPRPYNVHGYYCRLVLPNPGVVAGLGAITGGRSVLGG